jgi:hypothetical protein
MRSIQEGIAMFSAIARLVLLGSLLLAFAPARAAAQCGGDCDGTGTVTINELIIGVNIVLGTAPDSQCPNLGCTSGMVCINLLVRAVTNALEGCTVEIPALLSSDPADDASDVPATSWVRLTFAAPVSAAPSSFALTCGDAAVEVAVSQPQPDVIVLNPAPLLAGSCTAQWSGGEVGFAIAAGSAAATVLYDLSDTRRTSPFPNDVWTVPETANETGIKVSVPLPEAPDDVQAIFGGLLPETNQLDGFSPIAHIVVELSDAPDVATLPLSPAASLDPLASVGLFDLDAESATYLQRVPFLLKPRTDTSVSGVVSHTLLVFPSVPLRPGGRYGFVVTRRALVNPSRPFDKSDFFRAALQTPENELGESALRARATADEVLEALAGANPSFDSGDVALALRISVRTTDAIAGDMLAVKQQVLAAPPPAYTITSVDVQAQDSPMAAIVRGTWQAPEWRTEGDPRLYFARDGEGRPMQTGSKAIPFTLALPKAALDGAVPIAMYQHGNPGSSEAEVPSAARRSLAAAGFAVIGFTDVLNRELSAGVTDPDQAILLQVAPVLGGIVTNAKIPDFWIETRSEMLAFLRLFDGLGTLDVLPVGAPDGVPELDIQAPRVYLGISEGGNNGQGFLPYAPEIRAGAVMVGGARLGEVLIHQGADLFLNVLGAIYPGMTATDIWVGLSLFQTIFDVQDAHNHVRFLYRDRLEVAGTLTKPSVLVVEGLDDTLVPNHATDSMAFSMGPIPHIQPVQRAVPFLEVVSGPISGNIDAQTTSGFYQYVPAGTPGIPTTPGCESQPEGHYCAQSAPASFEQRRVFFQSALDGVPLIIDPMAEPVAAPFGSAGDPIVW